VVADPSDPAHLVGTEWTEIERAEVLAHLIRAARAIMQTSTPGCERSKR